MVLPTWLNPWVLLATVLLIAGAAAEGYRFGSKTAAQSAVATQALIDRSVNATREIALKSAATAISGITVKNTTIQAKTVQTLRTEVRYQDCKNTDQVKSLILESRGAVLQGTTP